jgi:alkylation response protein AidB-like acyl-CoA dehydrogenase
MDLELSPEQRALVDTFSQFFARECPTTRVRAAEPLGFDQGLWDALISMEVPGMGLPERVGGGGASMLDLALVGEEFGQCLAPVPFTEHVVAANLCASAGLQRVIDGCIDGSILATVACCPAVDGLAALVPAGAVADVVVVMDGDELVALERHGERPHALSPPNLGSSPLGDVHLDAPGQDRTVLARGSDAWSLLDRAADQRRILMAASLVGVGARAHELGVEYVKVRKAFGVTIGWFQTVAHRLADRCTELDGARLLFQEAAWAHDECEGNASELAAMAFLFASEKAFAAAADSMQFHGGYGYTLEYDIQLYFRRAKAWPLSVGRPDDEYLRLADLAFSEIVT